MNAINRGQQVSPATLHKVIAASAIATPKARMRRIGRSLSPATRQALARQQMG